MGHNTCRAFDSTSISSPLSSRSFILSFHPPALPIVHQDTNSAYFAADTRHQIGMWNIGWVSARSHPPTQLTSHQVHITRLESPPGFHPASYYSQRSM